MRNNQGLFHNRILSALIIVALSVSVLALYKSSAGTSNVADSLTTPIDMESIDSSSCIACHTDEGIISSLAVVSDASAHAAEGG